jgi:hypothetical protein
MIDTNENMLLETCVLGGRCDGRKPSVEPAVVEGSPPVPMIVRNTVIPISGAPADKAAPGVATYPAPGADRVFQDVVVKAFFSKPVHGVDNHSFTLTDSHGAALPALVDQIGDGAYGLFPHQLLLKGGETYTARLAAGICDGAGNCTPSEMVWSFQVAPEPEQGTGDTSVPAGFSAPRYQTLAPPVVAMAPPKPKKKPAHAAPDGGAKHRR